MRVSAIVIALALGLGMAEMSSLTFDTSSGKDRPVTKVVNLLKDMLKQLEKEAEEDEDIFNKMACWCETNDKEKTKSIADAESRINDLTTRIGELTSGSARLSTEIKNLENEVAENEDALQKATDLRKKELAEFNNEEKEAMQSIASVKAAITALSKHQGGALLQTEQDALYGAATVIGTSLSKNALLVSGVLSKHERKTLDAFIQAPEYEPQSGEIFGILQQMKETFETGLATSQKEETNNQKAFEELRAAKNEELKAGKAQIDSKTEELTNSDAKNAESKEDMEDTKNSLVEDEKFMVSLKEQCSMTDREWEARQKTRTQEMAAVSKTVAFLNSDEAHAMFSKTLGFIQKAQVVYPSHKAQTVLLQQKAKGVAKLNNFKEVIKSINKDIEAHLKSKQDDIKMRDFCIKELDEIEKQTAAKESEKGDLLDKKDDLKAEIADLEDNIEQLNREVEQLKKEKAEAGVDREKAHQEFQTTVADQRATQKLLTTALGFLKDFYDQKAALVQTRQEPPPPGFNEYKKSAGSGGAMSMIEGIISDAKTMEEEGTRSETEQQEAYENYVKETDASIKSKSDDAIAKSDLKGEKKVELVETKEALSGVMYELEELAHHNAETHKDCDFLLKNFEVRQDGFDTEVDGLRKSIQILKGSGLGL